MEHGFIGNPHSTLQGIERGGPLNQTTLIKLIWLFPEKKWQPVADFARVTEQITVWFAMQMQPRARQAQK